MADVNAEHLTGSLAFRLGVVGAAVTERFAEAIAAYGLKPKHAGLLALLSRGGPTSQLDLARTLHVAPSLMVALVDQLDGLGATQRIRDPEDRRRQIVSLTPEGMKLLATCDRIARRLDRDVTQALDDRQRRSLNELLGVVARHNGLTITPPS
jgi:DNA-binding MarR family transcriptional regulator